MTVTAASFQADFPEFAATSSGAINTQIALSGLFLNADRWGDLLDRATELFVAHYLTLSARNAAIVAAGGIPGGVSGPQSAKAVDKASASYDTKAVTAENAGHWNLTSYGIQLFQLAMMVGSGPIQL